MVDLVMIRTFEQSKIERFAAHSRVPVINGLTNEFHPCQILADLFTFIGQAWRARPPRPQGPVVAWVGDGNNMANTWLQAAEILGFTVHVSTPSGYEIDPGRSLASSTPPPQVFKTRWRPAAGADLVRPTSGPAWATRPRTKPARRLRQLVRRIAAMMARPSPTRSSCTACRPTAARKSTRGHRRPAVRGVGRAENRMHVQKALMEYLLLGRIG